MQKNVTLGVWMNVSVCVPAELAQGMFPLRGLQNDPQHEELQRLRQEALLQRVSPALHLSRRRAASVLFAHCEHAISTPSAHH